jgi:ribosome-associated protein
VQAVCTEIEEQLYKHLKRSPEHREGYRSAEWALLDFGSFIVHVFSDQARRYYDLERLWRSTPKLEIPDSPEVPAIGRSLQHSSGHENFSDEAVSK